MFKAFLSKNNEKAELPEKKRVPQGLFDLEALRAISKEQSVGDRRPVPAPIVRSKL